MTEEDILNIVKELKQQIEEMKGDDLEGEFEIEESKKRSQMLDLDPRTVDSFGDSIELITKSRLADNQEAYEIAKSFVRREYHNMMGNRYGKHSKLIPVFDDNGKPNKIDMVWFSGNKVQMVEIEGIVYYKIRLLVSDILTKKILLSRIPTGNGIARQEEIQITGAAQLKDKWLEMAGGLNQMKPINYNPEKSKKTTFKNVGEMVLE